MPHLSVEPNEKITFKVVHLDAHLVVVNKPARIVSTPGKGHDTNSLLNGLFARFGPQLQQLGRERDFGLLHRLDKMTSGLMVVALSKDAYDGLRGAFESRTVAKFYWAVVDGTAKKARGVVRLPIVEADAREKTADPRSKAPKKKLAKISASGQPAVTAYRVLQAGAAASLLECRPVTGRLHQVRVHLEAIGCPILGDDFYARAAVRDAAPRLALHAHRLVFSHPVTGGKIDARSPWPDDLRGLLRRLGLSKPGRDPAV